MKDKLVKHHKRKSYFAIRNIIIISLGVLFALSAVIVPVSISYVSSQNHTSQTDR